MIKKYSVTDVKRRARKEERRLVKELKFVKKIAEEKRVVLVSLDYLLGLGDVNEGRVDA